MTILSDDGISKFASDVFRMGVGGGKGSFRLVCEATQAFRAEGVGCVGLGLCVGIHLYVVAYISIFVIKHHL